MSHLRDIRKCGLPNRRAENERLAKKAFRTMKLGLNSCVTLTYCTYVVVVSAIQLPNFILYYLSTSKYCFSGNTFLFEYFYSTSAISTFYPRSKAKYETECIFSLLPGQKRELVNMQK